MTMLEIEKTVIYISEICNSENQKIVFDNGYVIEGTAPQVVIRFIDGEWEVCLEDGWHLVFAMKNIKNELIKEEACFCGNNIVEALNALKTFCEDMKHNHRNPIIS